MACRSLSLISESLFQPRGQWRTEKNGGNWLRNHLWCPNDPRRDRWWWNDVNFFFFLNSTKLLANFGGRLTLWKKTKTKQTTIAQLDEKTMREMEMLSFRLLSKWTVSHGLKTTGLLELYHLSLNTMKPTSVAGVEDFRVHYFFSDRMRGRYFTFLSLFSCLVTVYLSVSSMGFPGKSADCLV